MLSVFNTANAVVEMRFVLVPSATLGADQVGTLYSYSISTTYLPAFSHHAMSVGNADDTLCG